MDQRHTYARPCGDRPRGGAHMRGWFYCHLARPQASKPKKGRIGHGQGRIGKFVHELARRRARIGTESGPIGCRSRHSPTAANVPRTTCGHSRMNSSAISTATARMVATGFGTGSRSAHKRTKGANRRGPLPSCWNHVGSFASGPLATPQHRVAAAGQNGESHGVGGGLGDGTHALEQE